MRGSEETGGKDDGTEEANLVMVVSSTEYM